MVVDASGKNPEPATLAHKVDLTFADGFKLSILGETLSSLGKSAVTRIAVRSELSKHDAVEQQAAVPIRHGAPLAGVFLLWKQDVIFAEASLLTSLTHLEYVAAVMLRV